MTERTPLRRYTLWDHSLGMQVTTREQHLEAVAEDRAKAGELAEQLAEVGLVAAMGRFGYDGPPFYATVMAADEHAHLLERRMVDGTRPVGGLTYGDIRQTTNYVEGQLTYLATLEQAMSIAGIELSEPEPEPKQLAA